MPTLAFLPNIGPWEIALILGLGVLLFGRRLPEVGRSLGRSIIEFKKGVKGVGDEIDDEIEAERERDRDRKRERAKLEAAETKPPLTPSGEDPRVSRAESVEHAEATPKTDPAT